MIEAVCWDVGGVFTGRPFDAIDEVAEEQGVTSESLLNAVFGSYGEDTDHTWHRLERGEIPLAEAWPLLEAGIQGLGIDFTLGDLLTRFGQDPQDRTVVWDVARDLHASGIAMAVVTNNIREFSGADGGPGWCQVVPMELMSVVVDSSEVGMRKPSAGIYHHVLAELGVVPEVAVFVDDTQANVEAAVAVGMHGVLVGSDPAPAMAQLREFSGLS